MTVRRAILAGFLTALIPASAAAQPAGTAVRPNAHAAAEAKAKHCTRHRVGGHSVCLLLGRRCITGLQHDYLKFRFACRGRKLRRASLADLRQGEPVLIDSHGQIDPRDALEAFATAVAPLPGVRPRPGAVGPIDDPSSIIQAVVAQRSHLTAAQVAVVDKVTTPDPETTQVPGVDTVPAPGPPVAHLAVDPAVQAAFVSLVVQARQRIIAHGYGFVHNITLSFPASAVTPGSGVTALAYTVPGWLGNDPATATNTCNIFVTPLGVAQDLADQRNTIAHEVFHCAQNELFPSLAAKAVVPQWVIEGGAEWAGDQIALEWNGADKADGNWKDWFARPDLDLGARTYDAIGFWSLLGQSGVDVFAQMKSVLRSGGDATAYHAAILGVPNRFFDSWGTSYIRRAALGPSWDLKGPGIVASSPPASPVIADGVDFTRDADPRGAGAARLRLVADVITISASIQHGRMLSRGVESPLESGLFCTRAGGCPPCPGGGSLDAKPLPKGDTFIGWQGGLVSIQGSSLAQECKKLGKGGNGPAGTGGKGAAGIMLFQKSVGNGLPLVTSFRSGACSTSGGSFRATSSSGGYSLSVTIRHFSGFGPHYVLRFQSSDPTFIVRGPHGPFSNVYFPGGTPPAAGGAIAFSSTGATMGLGFINAFNAAGSDAIALAGHMACNYPRRR